MIPCNKIENKAMLAKEIRGKLEDVVKTGSVVIHLENCTGEELLFEHNKIDTGIYRISLLNRDEVINNPLKLEKLKLNLSIRV